MPSSIKTSLLLFVLLTAATASQAQADKKQAPAIAADTLAKKDSVPTAKSYFKADINFVSNAVYLGRKDSANLPYITPTIGYYDKSGVYATVGAGYSTHDKRVDYFSIDAGYEFDLTKKLSGTVYGNKTFYNDSSSNISSDIKGSIGAGLTYDFGFVELHGGTDISFANKTDFGVNLSLAHSFYIGDEGKQWTIAPAALVNFNTLNFYEGYTNRTSGKKQKLKNPLVTSVKSTTVVTNRNPNSLTLMDYEFSVPVSYDAKKWGVYLTPTIAVPQNPIYTTTTNVVSLRSPPAASPSQTNIVDSTPDSEKKLQSNFYVELGVYFKF